MAKQFTFRFASAKRILWIVVTALIFLECAFTDSFAHPHVFIDYSISVMFNDEGLAALKFHWTFDEMFSEQALQKYPSAKTGKLTPKDIGSIKKELFDSLKEYQYFTMVKLDGKYFPVNRIEGFWAEVKKGKLSFTYVVPCPLKASKEFRFAKALVCDEEYYNDFEFSQKGPVSFVNDSNYTHSFEIKEDPALKYYFGQVIPQVLTIKFRRKQ
ncbi:MAG: DUF1007 family protein [Desulfomonilaceae bacterium]